MKKLLKNKLKKSMREFKIVLANILDKFLIKYGDQVGIPPNIQARISHRATRKMMDDPEHLYKFWSQSHPHGNYFTPPKWSEKSEAMIRFISPIVSQNDSILEIGCNIGINLNHLWKSGFQKLRGVEISKYAVKRLREYYPVLENVIIDIGPAETRLRDYDSNSFEMVFTMAVLEHIHPESRDLFFEISRIASKYVLAIEPSRAHASHRQFPWNIEEEFLEMGLTLIKKQPWISLCERDISDGLEDYDCFLFRV